MEVHISRGLEEYMAGSGRKNIAVEVAKADHSDFDVTELYVRLVDDRTADYLERKRGYRSLKTSSGRLLLPSYRLEFDRDVSFDVKKFWIFHKVTMEGIRL